MEKNCLGLWNHNLAEYEKAITGDCVVAAWNKYKQVDGRVREAIMGLLDTTGSDGFVQNRPVWRDANSIVMSTNSNLLAGNTQHARLSELAFRESSIRWRFLGLYRVLEHGLLELIFDELKRRFLRAPQDTVEWARSALKTDLSKLVELVKASALESSFESFQKVAHDIRSSNRFVAALEHQWEGAVDRKRFEGNWRKGLFLCYKTRCAIVHAGDAFLIYEKYEDADRAVAEFLVPLEEAVFKYLGLVMS